MRVGQWAHCGCGCYTTGRVIDMGGEEATIMTPEGNRVYPADKLERGALCYVCGKPADVVLEVVEEGMPAVTFCLYCFSRVGALLPLNGLTYKAAYALAQEDKVVA